MHILHKSVQVQVKIINNFSVTKLAMQSMDYPSYSKSKFFSKIIL